MADKVPHLVPGFDVKTLKLDPMDGFVFSRIDGRLGPRELARETGLPDFSVARALEKLQRLGAVALLEPGAPAPARSSSAPTAPPPPSAVSAPSAVTQFDSGLLAPKYDPAELDEPAELTREQKKRVLDVYYRLDDVDHYSLLGVPRDADKKRIKRAYFELAALFHPDRYFKKQLGSFKGKMEVLFTRVTEAHDTLLNPEGRAEYDAYLSETATTRGMETLLERALADAARASAEGRPSAPPTAPPPGVTARPTATTSPPSTPPPPASAPAPSTPPVPPPSKPSAEELQRRREALARRLTGSLRPTAHSAPPPPKPSPLRYASAQDAVDALKRRYEDRLASATQAQAQRYLEAAEDAIARHDLVAASTAYGLAAKFAPEDAALAAKAGAIKQEAERSLSESYIKQAEHEETQGHWADAARSWQKVAKLTHDAGAHARAARALLEADGDLHQAAEHAKQAITLAPSVIEHHLGLVEAYMKAGLGASARRAAEAASTLDPKSEKVQAVLKRLGKG